MQFYLDTIEKYLNPPRGREYARVKLYKGWDYSKIQRGRYSYIYNKQIISYFLRIFSDKIEIFSPKNSTNEPDITIPFENISKNPGK